MMTSLIVLDCLCCSGLRLLLVALTAANIWRTVAAATGAASLVTLCTRERCAIVFALDLRSSVLAPHIFRVEPVATGVCL